MSYQKFGKPVKIGSSEFTRYTNEATNIIGFCIPLISQLLLDIKPFLRINENMMDGELYRRTKVLSNYFSGIKGEYMYVFSLTKDDVIRKYCQKSIALLSELIDGCNTIAQSITNDFMKESIDIKPDNLRLMPEKIEKLIKELCELTKYVDGDFFEKPVDVFVMFEPLSVYGLVKWVYDDHDSIYRPDKKRTEIQFLVNSFQEMADAVDKR